MDLPSSTFKAGLTLIELLVTLGVIAVIAAMLFPVINKFATNAKQAQCINNLRQLYTGIMAYAADNQMEIPVDRNSPASGTSWYSAISSYLPHGGYGKKLAPYFCPANPAPVPSSGPTGWTNYAINGNLYLVDTSLANHGQNDPDFRSKRRGMRFHQIDGIKALLIDAYDGNKQNPSTWYVMNGARYSNPWSATHAVHGQRVNVLFTDGHVESPRVEPRIPDPSTTRGDLNELKAEWFWPL